MRGKYSTRSGFVPYLGDCVVVLGVVALAKSNRQEQQGSPRESPEKKEKHTRQKDQMIVNVGSVIAPPGGGVIASFLMMYNGGLIAPLRSLKAPP